LSSSLEVNLDPTKPYWLKGFPMSRSDEHIELLKAVLAEKYDVVRLLAAGGMGEIYLAVHRVLKQNRAIKIIHQSLDKDEGVRQRFLQEATLAAGIDHPGIIQIIDYGSHEDFDYLIMPYIEGIDLEARLKEGPFDPKEALDLMITMADAIACVHQKDIVHRDIKPSNYMLDNYGRMILTDFGISKNLGGESLTATNMLLGSPKYISPEQITGNRVDNRSDLYSLGLVFYQMLTGVHPFDAVDPASLAYQQVHKKPSRPSEITGGITRKLDQIILRLVEKDPEKRYPDGEALKLDLQKVRSASPKDHLSDASALQLRQSGRFHEMATQLMRPLNKTILKGRPSAAEDGQAEIDKTISGSSARDKSKKRKLFAAAVGGFAVLLIGFSILLVGVFEDSKKRPREALGTGEKAAQPSNSALKGAPPPEAMDKKKKAPRALTLRPDKSHFVELHNKMSNIAASLVRKDIRRLFSLKTGCEMPKQEPQYESMIRQFLAETTYSHLAQNNGACDLIISMEDAASGKRLRINSSFYGENPVFGEAFIVTEAASIPFYKISLILKRNYCFNLLYYLESMGGSAGGENLKITLPNPSSHRLTIGDEAKFCVRAPYRAYCMLLNINLDGIYKLFPRNYEETYPIPKDGSHCLEAIQVTRPAGNELVVAVAFGNEDDMSEFSHKFTPDNYSFYCWPLNDESPAGAVAFCEDLVLALAREPNSEWSCQAELIHVVENK